MLSVLSASDRSTYAIPAVEPQMYRPTGLGTEYAFAQPLKMPMAGLRSKLAIFLGEANGSFGRLPPLIDRHKSTYIALASGQSPKASGFWRADESAVPRLELFRVISRLTWQQEQGSLNYVPLPRSAATLFMLS